MLQSTNRSAARLAPLVAALLCGLFGCHARRSAPQPRRSAPNAASGVPASSAPRVDASAAAPKVDAARARVAQDAGNWSKCYEHFRPGPQPKVDVLQLGILCGPSNGMTRVKPSAKPLKGATGTLYTWLARPQDCYRLFAVAPRGSSRLAVEVQSPRHRSLVELSTGRRWLVVNPDAPLCVRRAGRYRAKVWVEHASARPEVQLWRLR